jgi:hypothetical protein
VRLSVRDVPPSRRVVRGAGLAVVPLLLGLTLAACGSSGDGGGSGDAAGGGSRPSVSDLAKALQAESTKVTPKAATCLAKTMESSSLSDTALQAVVTNNQNYQPDADDSAALKKVTAKLIQCVGTLVPSGSASAMGSGLASAGSIP